VSYCTYPQYQESGVEWLCQLPVGWQTKRLKDVIACPITDGPHLTPEFHYEGVPFLSVDGIQNGELQFEGSRFISEEDHRLFSQKVAPKKGDILLGKAASTGKIAQVKVDLEFSIWSPLALIRPDKNQITPTFLEYALKSPVAQAQIDVLCTHNTQSNISMDDIPKLTFPIPSISEQELIAAFLDWKTSQIDALIAKKQELLQKLKEKRLAVITQAVTKGLNPDAPLRDSGVAWIGNVPDHWEVIPLGFLMTMSGGMTPSMANSEYWEGEIPWVTPKDMKQPRIFDSIDHITDAALAETAISLIPIDAILVVVRGMILAHSFPTAVTEQPVTINQDMKALRCGERLDTEYLFWCLNGFAKVLSNLAQESAHGTRKVETQTLKKFQLPLPPMFEQKAVVEALAHRLNQLDQLAESTDETITRLTEYRTALITAATTGKIDVRNWQATQTTT
jgi:type I restriction enzyme S subunit